MLPKGYDYHVCVIEIPDPCKPEHFKVGFRLPISKPEQLDQWVEEYQKVSFTQWRIGRGNRRSKAVKILYQKGFKCQHNIYERKDKNSKRSIDHTKTWRGSQNTGCQAKLTIAIKVHVKEISKNRLSRSRDVHMPDYPTMVTISHTHNHERHNEFALRFRNVDKSVAVVYEDLFKAGHSALTAHSYMQWQRWAEYGTEYEKRSVDRAYNPDMAYVYRLFYRMLRERKPHVLKARKTQKKQRGKEPSQHTTPEGTSNSTTLGTESGGIPAPVGLAGAIKHTPMVSGEASNHATLGSGDSPMTMGFRGATSAMSMGLGGVGNLDTEVLMEGDEREGDTSPPQKKRKEEDARIEDGLDGNPGGTSDVHSVEAEPGVLADNTSLLNSSGLDASMGESQEEGEKDFFAHGYKMRVPGSNRARRITVNLTELYEDLEQLISKHVNETHPAHAHLARITGDRDDMIIAICTPLMRRAHTDLPQSGELCIIDSTFQSFGQNSCQVVSFMTPTAGGGVPLGFLVLSSLDQVFLTQGLELFKMLIPDDGFGGRGRLGPAYFLTDEEHFVGEIVQGMFPDAKVSISPYHLILAAWRWIVDTKRRIDPEDQFLLLDLVKQLIACQSSEELQSIHLKILGTNMNETYRDFVPYVIESIGTRWEEWLLPADHPIHRLGVGTHPWQAVMHCLWDRVLMKGRHFNILQMTHFLLNGVDSAYERNLQEGCKIAPSDLSFAPLFTELSITKDGIKELAATKYLVTAKSKSALTLLTVKSDMGLCSCLAGKSGYFCCHLAAVIKQFSLPANARLALKGQEKYRIHKVATGEKMVNEQLTDTMQQLARVVELNPETLNDPIRSFIKQIERADTTSGLARALEKFKVLTKEEEREKNDEEERDGARREEELAEREKGVQEEFERQRKENEMETTRLKEERQKWQEEQRFERERTEREEKKRLETWAWRKRQMDRWAEEDKGKEGGKQRKKDKVGGRQEVVGSRRRAKGEDGVEELILSKDSLIVEPTISSANDALSSLSCLAAAAAVVGETSPKNKTAGGERKVREEDAGKKERTPAMTPGRAVTRGVTRMNIHKNATKEKCKTRALSRDSKQPSSSSSPPSSSSPSSAIAANKVQIESLKQENAQDRNLVVVMSEDKGMLLKGIPACTDELGKVLVINQPMRVQRVGRIVMKGPKKGKKGKS